MGPVQPFSFLGSFMVRVVTWFLVLLSTNLTVLCQGIETVDRLTDMLVMLDDAPNGEYNSQNVYNDVSVESHFQVGTTSLNTWLEKILSNDKDKAIVIV